MHFAGSKSVPESLINPVLYYHNNIIGTINLLNAMQKTNVHDLVFSSSAAVYGNSEKPIKEDYPLNPSHTYGKTKLIIENILQDLCEVSKDWNVTILRYFNPTGSYENGKLGENSINKLGNLFPAILKVISKEIDKLSIYGNKYNTKDGTCIRDFIHITDLAKGHLCALKEIGLLKNYNVYNLGTGKGYTISEVVKCFENIISSKIPIEFVSPRVGDVIVSIADPTKAFHELNWKTNKDLYQMCQDSLKWELEKNCTKNKN
jgi:UDP-glucose 4-epimerase